MSRLNLSLKYDYLKYVWYAGLPSAEKLFEVSAHPAVADSGEGPGGRPLVLGDRLPPPPPHPLSQGLDPALSGGLCKR